LPALERHVVDAAELAARTPGGLVRRDAVADEIGGVGVEVEAHLVGEIVFELTLVEEGRDE
jgi:hypothetical protein